MKGRAIVKLCGAAVLLVGCSLATFAAVRALTPPAESTPTLVYPYLGQAVYTSASGDSESDAQWRARWQYTQADLDLALGLKTGDYQDKSVEDFAKALADWTDETVFHQREDMMARLRRTYATDGAEADFILRTLEATIGEASTRHYGGHCTALTDSFSDGAARERYEDVFGDDYMVFQAWADYLVRYTIKDAAALTVGERDRILNAYRDGVQAFLDGKTEAQLLDGKNMRRALASELKRLDQTLSTSQMALEGSELSYYDAYGPEG